MPVEPRLQQLLDRYKDLRRQGQTVVLQELCADTPELLQELQTCVQALESRSAPTGSEATLSLALADGPSATTQPTSPRSAVEHATARTWPTIPGYEILDRIGGGGMGVVYKARQIGLNRVVALKMIKTGSHASEPEIARFRTEAEAVARLQHPNIVQIHAIGDHDGLPFFSLEYCSAGSLSRQLDGTPLPSRVAAQLVETLARAIHVAHEHGILHRDLKPANVLLKEEGGRRKDENSRVDSAFRLHPSSFVPKIADFGLAKKLDDADGQTQGGMPIGTPSYMSPEQARGDVRALGPATDVYALGVILYELLTGRPPFKAASMWDTVQQVLHNEPVPPRRLQPQTPRDLDVICWKCLAKEPRRRYRSALDLADDLRRFLAGEPIHARPISTVERAVKWLRRRPAAAALIACLALGVVGVVVGTWWHIQQLSVINRELTDSIEREQQLGQLAKQNETRALNHAAAAAEQSEAARRRLGYAMEAVNTMLTRTSNDKTLLLNVPHLETVRAKLLEDALALYQQFLKEESRDAKVRFETAKALDRVASIQHSLRRLKESADQYESALRLFTELSGEQDHADFALALGMCRNGYAIVLDELGRAEDSRRQHEQVADLFRRARFQSNDVAQNGLAICLNNLARLHFQRKATAEAEKCFVEALSIHARLLPRHPADAEYLTSAARCHLNFAILLEAQKRNEDASAQYGAAIKIYQELADREPAMVDYRSHLAQARNSFAVYLHRRGDLDGAEREHAAVVAVRQKLVNDFPSFPQFQQDLAGTCNNLAILFDRRGNRSEAEKHFQLAVTMREKLVAGQPDSLDNWQKLVRSRSNLAMFYQSHRRPPDHVVALRALTAVHDRLPDRFKTDRYLLDHFAKTHDALATHLTAAGQTDEALQHTRIATSLRKQIDRPEME